MRKKYKTDRHLKKYPPKVEDHNYSLIYSIYCFRDRRRREREEVERKRRDEDRRREAERRRRMPPSPTFRKRSRSRERLTSREEREVRYVFRD